MKIVADTMMWVSFCTAPDGPRHRTLAEAKKLRVRIFVSEYILTELSDTLGEIFNFRKRLIRDACQVVAGMCKEVALSSPQGGWVTGDPDDDPIVHTALLAKADYLVTADRVLLKLKQVEDVRIINLRELGELLGMTNYLS